MDRAKLAELISDEGQAVRLFEAVGQRVVRVDPAWDWESQGAVCECDLLMVELPRPVRLERTVVTFGRPMPVRYDVTHVHVADIEGRLLCPDCAWAGEPCGVDHAALMCDTPKARPCEACWEEAALPGRDFCLGCRPAEPCDL